MEFARREVERTKDHAAAMENEISELHTSLSTARNRTVTATSEIDNLKETLNCLNDEKKQTITRWEAAEQDAIAKTDTAVTTHVARIFFWSSCPRSVPLWPPDTELPSS